MTSKDMLVGFVHRRKRRELGGGDLHFAHSRGSEGGH